MLASLSASLSSLLTDKAFFHFALLSKEAERNIGEVHLLVDSIPHEHVVL